MTIRTTLDQRGPITQEESEMLERARHLPVVFDDDSPELTEEELKGFRRVSEENRSEHDKRTATPRPSPQASRKVRSLGKGYIAVSSRTMEGKAPAGAFE